MVLCEHAQLASVDFFKKVGNFNWPCRNENILESLSDCWYKESPQNGISPGISCAEKESMPATRELAWQRFPIVLTAKTTSQDENESQAMTGESGRDIALMEMA